MNAPALFQLVMTFFHCFQIKHEMLSWCIGRVLFLDNLAIILENRTSWPCPSLHKLLLVIVRHILGNSGCLIESSIKDSGHFLSCYQVLNHCIRVDVRGIGTHDVGKVL
jgi:hypothetical protein